jgi:hypothetical protein
MVGTLGVEALMREPLLGCPDRAGHRQSRFGLPPNLSLLMRGARIASAIRLRSSRHLEPMPQLAQSCELGEAKKPEGFVMLRLAI